MKQWATHGVILAVLVTMAGGCNPDEEGLLASASKRQGSGQATAAPTSGPTLDPTVAPGPTPGQTASPTPTPSPSPTPTSSPSPTPSPDPTPSPTPTPPVVQRVIVTPQQVTLNAESPLGTNAPGYVSSLRLSADVSYSDGSVGHEVSWTSLDSERAVVQPDGTVTIPSGATPGLVKIRADAGGLSDWAYITVTSLGDISLTVE